MDALEIKTEAQLFWKGEKAYLLYEERDKDGTTTKCRLKFDTASLEMTRQGASHTRLVFEPSKEYCSDYHTAFGAIPINLMCTKLSVLESEETIKIRLAYRMEMGGQSLDECLVKIECRAI